MTRLQNLRRAQGDPPVTEIWSGRSLNDLLIQVQIMESQQAQGPNVPLIPSILRQINVTDGTSQVGLGLLKNAGRLNWPPALQDDEYEASRSKLDELLPQAVQAPASGSVDGKTIRELTTEVNRLRGKLKANVANIPSTECVQAKRYLNDLEASIKVLRDPNVANYVTGRWAARGRNVPELVRSMTDLGLRFASAVAGDETAYTTLHRFLAAYEHGTAEMVSKK